MLRRGGGGSDLQGLVLEEELVDAIDGTGNHCSSIPPVGFLGPSFTEKLKVLSNGKLPLP